MTSRLVAETALEAGPAGVGLRLRVPLIVANFTDRDRRPLHGLYSLGPGLVLSRVEASRDEFMWGGPRTFVTWELEIAAGPLLANVGRHEAETLVRRVLALLTCAVRFAPSWHRILVDHWVDGTWVETQVFTIRGGEPSLPSFVPEERIETWARLLEHWPLLGLDPVVDSALDLYYESIELRRSRPTAAFLLAAASLESLLGDALSDQAVDRAVTLLIGEQEDMVRATIQSWSEARTLLKQRGIPPDEKVLVSLHRFLMRALPTMGRLLLAVGREHRHAIDWLDTARADPAALHNSLVSDGTEPWWDYMPVTVIVE